jgi:hypothetical protein
MSSFFTICGQITISLAVVLPLAAVRNPLKKTGSPQWASTMDCSSCIEFGVPGSEQQTLTSIRTVF